MATIDNFAVFILTHGRPDRVTTYDTLRKQGYTGDVYIIIDSEDDTAARYQTRFGDRVIIFDKVGAAKITDAADNFAGNRGVVFARNASFGIAEDLGLDYFLVLDDDYTKFVWKFTASLRYREAGVKDLDCLFKAMLRYYESIGAVTIAFAQNGDFIGGAKSTSAQTIHLKRKAMNTFFCSPARPFSFFGRINEDVNAYVTWGMRGLLMLTVMNAGIIQRVTQSNAGGLTELYLDLGTYIKSFYTVMCAPSCVKVNDMGHTHRRLHHKISWANAVPCILDEKWQMGQEPVLLES